jgi:hypothetical protein
MDKYRQLPLPGFTDLLMEALAAQEATNEPVVIPKPISDMCDQGWIQLTLPGFEILVYDDNRVSTLK